MTTKTINGKNYEVRELLLRDISDLIGRDDINFSLELFKRAVMVDGAVLGDAADDLPLSHYTALLKLVNKINSIEAEPGND